MSSYFSSLKTSSAISNLGTRLNSLRRTITSGDESDDPENEDCSHISNVLRAYYAEKGRALPPWLPPDPKNPTPQPRMVVTQASLQQQQQGVPYHQQQQRPPGSRSGSGGGLGDLWGDSGAPSQPPSQTGSLRSRPGNLRQQSSQSLTPSVSSQVYHVSFPFFFLELKLRICIHRVDRASNEAHRLLLVPRHRSVYAHVFKVQVLLLLTTLRRQAAAISSRSLSRFWVRIGRGDRMRVITQPWSWWSFHGMPRCI